MSRQATLPSFAGATTSDDAAAERHRRFISVPLTEAGGTIGAHVIVPALAGYTGHALVTGIWCPAGTTDAANTWTFAVAAGTILGPDVFTMNLTALRYHFFTAGVAGVYGQPIALRGTVGAGADDNKAITIQAADLAIVGIDYYIEGVYWYET